MVTIGLPNSQALATAQALEAYHLAGDPGQHAHPQAVVLNNLATTELRHGDLVAAQDYAERGIALLAGVDSPLSVQALLRLNLGHCRLRMGHAGDDVTALFVDALDYTAQVRSPMILAWNLDGLAEALALSQP